MAHRRGILSKDFDRETKRRKEAAESGVVLEKARAVAKFTKPREKGIGGPNIGKFRSGTLTLNSRDLRSIQGPKMAARGGQKGRGRSMS
jgi:hypothetical protein